MQQFDRKYHQIPQGEGQMRHVTIITTPPCAPPPTVAARISFHDLLQRLAEQPDLSDCGGHAPTKLEVQHDGEKWVAVAEVTVDRA